MHGVAMQSEPIRQQPAASMSAVLSITSQHRTVRAVQSPKHTSMLLKVTLPRWKIIGLQQLLLEPKQVLDGLHHGMVRIGYMDVVTLLKPIDSIMQGLFGFAYLGELWAHDVCFLERKT